jgi:hypothetical protein
MASLILTGLTLLAAIASLTGLAWLVANVAPARPLAMTAAYVFGFVAITSTAALLMWIAIRPRSREDGALKSPAGYVAHAMLLAILVLFGLWLQSLRTLTPLVAVLLLGLYIVLELAVLLGTRGSVELPIRR